MVSSTDPAPYIQCCVHLEPDQQGLYVRGDDMPQFPGRSVCEELMPIKLLPYTKVRGGREGEGVWAVIMCVVRRSCIALLKKHVSNSDLLIL